MRTIIKSQLKQYLDQKQDLLLIDVLPREMYIKQHIPGAVNIPIKDNENFLKDVEARVESEDQLIVVYCANIKCDASEKAAQKLESAGFSNVRRFEEGLEGWFGKKEMAA
jgi:rhodanese-related sulfurtransferase